MATVIKSSPVINESPARVSTVPSFLLRPLPLRFHSVLRSPLRITHLNPRRRFLFHCSLRVQRPLVPRQRIRIAIIAETSVTRTWLCVANKYSLPDERSVTLDVLSAGIHAGKGSLSQPNPSPFLSGSGPGMVYLAGGVKNEEKFV